MDWEQISLPWKVAINQAWIAYCAGSLPIGAAIMSPDGQIVAEGRNRLYDVATDGDLQHFRQHFMAHAEQNAFISLGIVRREQPDIKHSLKDFVLYTTLEPCDMCIGTLIQSGIKSVQYLVPDPMGGAIDSLRATPRVRDKQIQVQGPQPGSLANIVLAIFTVSIAQTGVTVPDDIISLLSSYSDGFALGKLLVQSRELEQFHAMQMPITSVYDLLTERLHTLGGSGLPSALEG
jgi:tRNA(adenine34) deaminase